MSRTTRLLAFVPLAFIVAACTPAPAAPPDTSADVTKISALREEWAKDFNAADATALGDLYTADATDMPSGQPAVTGRDAIVQLYAGLLSQTTLHVTLTSTETRVAGDWAFDRGTYDQTMTPTMAADSMAKNPMPAAAPVTDHGKYLVILQKQADGSWKLARDISNSDAPPPAMPAMPATK
jgi:uncharacterized protein (TIGR02246 family)